MIDAYRVERLPADRQGAGAAMAVFGYRLGMLVSGAGALYVADGMGWFAAYAAMAIAMGVGVIAVLAGPEPVVDRSHALAAEAAGQALFRRVGAGGALGRAGGWLHAAVVSPFSEFLTRPNAWLILAFVVFYKFGDSLAGVMTNPFLIEIGFDKTQIAEVSKLFGFWATLGGLWVGGTLLGTVGIVRALWICGVLQALSNLAFMVQAQAGADVALLAAVVGFENLAGGMGTAVFVAYLSSLCNVSYTATQYALLSSFMAVARTWLSSSGACWPRNWAGKPSSWQPRSLRFQG
ncbi:MFS transporter [Tistrella bauzanensis]